MKKFTLVICATILWMGVSGQNNACNDLFISEMIEGNAPNRALEIFNPSDVAIDLNDFSIRLFQNGQLTPLIIPLTGTLPAKSTFVIAHPAAKNEIKTKADMLDPQLSFDGNDAIVLEKTGGTQVDKIGEIGVNPGNGGWFVPPNGSTKEQALRRKPPIDKGETNWNQGKNQWEVHPKDSVSNLKQHQNVCSAGANDVFFALANQQVTGTDTLFLEYDITIRANTDSTFLQLAIINITFDEIVFGSNPWAFGRITTTIGSAFNKPTYIENNSGTLGGYEFVVVIDINESVFDRTEIPLTPIPLFHVKMEILDCNVSTNIFYTGTILNSSFNTYTTTPDDPALLGSAVVYDNSIYENEIDTVPCGQGIVNYTSPVYPGTFYYGTSDLGYLLTINGQGFGTSQGSGNVFFRDANDGGQTITALDASDFISWTDTEIQIKMPSRIETPPYEESTPGSGVFTVATSTGDSLSSGTPIDIPYSILNAPAFGKKARVDLVNVSGDSTGIIFYLGTSITTHPDPLVEIAARKAVKDWACFTQVNFEIGGETTTNVSDTDGVSVIHFVNAFPGDSTVLAKTTLWIGACLAANGDTVFFPKDIDIALLADPTTIGVGTWYFDSTGAIPANSNDFFEAILHEIGHAGLLKHVNDDELMNFAVLYDAVDPIPAISRRWVSSDDYDGAADVIDKGTGITLAGSCPFKGLTLSDFVCVNTPPIVDVNENIREEESGNIRIYPNPTSEDGFNISYNLYERSIVHLTLIDYTGKTIISHGNYRPSGNHEEYVEMGDVASGLYFVVLNINGAQLNFKVLKL